MTRESLVSSSERTSEAQSGGDWNALLAQYGQAMMQVGKLEEEARDLRERLTELQGGGGNNLDAPLKEKDEELRQKNQIIASLRLQVSSLSEELDSRREKLKLAAEGKYSRNRRHHQRTPWWQIWKNRR